MNDDDDSNDDEDDDGDDDEYGNDLSDEVTHLVALAPHLLPARDVWKHLDQRVKEGRNEILHLGSDLCWAKAKYVCTSV